MAENPLKRGDLFAWASRQGFVEEGFWCGYKGLLAKNWTDSADSYGEYKIVKTKEEIEAAKRKQEEDERHDKEPYRCPVCKKMVKGRTHVLPDVPDLKENPTHHPMGKSEKNCFTMELKTYCSKGKKLVAYELAMKRDDSVPLEFDGSQLKCGCGCGALCSSNSDQFHF